MKQLIFPFLLIFATSIFAQIPDNKPFVRKGFIFGAAVGGSAIRLASPNLGKETQFSLSFPNFKLGYMLTPKTALLLYLPGSIYKYKGASRTRDRGFEGIIPAAQYWITDKWWVLAGVGLTFDAPAFYEVKNPSEANFYFGTSLLASTGYELWRKGKFALDVQARTFYGYSNTPEGKRTGFANNLLIGFNWY